MNSAQPDADIASFRRFNRMYTRVIGTLNDGLLSSEFSLSEARILYELATREGPRASDIATALEIDPAYLSRILAKFERSGLLKRASSKRDGRALSLELTRKGKTVFRKLDTRSAEQARAILRSTGPAAQELLESMHKIERILTQTEPASAPIVLRPHRVGDMGWIVYRESVGYAEQFGWDGQFEALVAQIVRDFLANFDAVRERCWIAEMEGRNLGHIFLVRHPEQRNTAKLRLLFVEPSARGLGIGDALVKECVRFARTAGYRKVVLWTQSILTAAHRLYQKAGFRLIREEPHHSFGHDLVGQEWELEL